jgi:hypothetical protein
VEGLSSSNARTSYRVPVLTTIGVATTLTSPAIFTDPARSGLLTLGTQMLVLVWTACVNERLHLGLLVG